MSEVIGTTAAVDTLRADVETLKASNAGIVAMLMEIRATLERVTGGQATRNEDQMQE